jgi:glycosyltransferase involved in cell wall biosynthesis
MNKPLLSVLIDTYNHERYIEQAVVGAIEQDFPASDYEILVVDDGSTDRTPEIVRKFAPRVRLLRKKNGGQASAFNAAVAELRGENVAFLDGDDWFAPGKLTAVMNALETHPEAAAVSHGYYEFREDTKEIRVCAASGPEFLHMATLEAARDALDAWRFLLMGALTVRKQVFNRVIPIREALVFCADSPIAFAAMVMGVWLLRDPLFYYRHHSSNLHSVDPSSPQMQRRLEMKGVMFAEVEALLLRMGVDPDWIVTLLYPTWVHEARLALRTFGGNRRRTFGTEMHAFRMQYRNPTLSYRIFKYLIVGTATLLLAPKAFYRAWDWYGRQNLGRWRERLVSNR